MVEEKDEDKEELREMREMRKEMEFLRSENVARRPEVQLKTTKKLNEEIEDEDEWVIIAFEDSTIFDGGLVSW